MVHFTSAVYTGAHRAVGGGREYHSDVGVAAGVTPGPGDDLLPRERIPMPVRGGSLTCGTAG